MASHTLLGAGAHIHYQCMPFGYGEETTWCMTLSVRTTPEISIGRHHVSILWPITDFCTWMSNTFQHTLCWEA